MRIIHCTVRDYYSIILIIIHCNNFNKKNSKEILTNRIDITNKEKILNVKVLYFYCIKYAHKT